MFENFKGWFKSPKEIVLALVTLMLLALLVVKSLVWDPNLGPLSVEEASFLSAVEATLDEGFRQKWPYQWQILKIRVIDISAAGDQALADAKKLDTPPVYPYVAKVRKYLFGFLPIGELSLMK